mmetsp:Transcript_7027/g.22488  ORF Transcript_7027/g.22488 Transcript_7027/m.22488 type:complete len:406 (-) Transcript_7027:373-1590(-)
MCRCRAVACSWSFKNCAICRSASFCSSCRCLSASLSAFSCSRCSCSCRSCCCSRRFFSSSSCFFFRSCCICSTTNCLYLTSASSSRVSTSRVRRAVCGKSRHFESSSPRRGATSSLLAYGVHSPGCGFEVSAGKIGLGHWSGQSRALPYTACAWCDSSQTTRRKSTSSCCSACDAASPPSLQTSLFASPPAEALASDCAASAARASRSIPPIRLTPLSSVAEPASTTSASLLVPPMMSLVRRALSAASAMIRSSTVLSDASRITRTGRVCPIRWHRSIACLSAAGLKSESCKITVSADVRLMPSPPARVVTSSAVTVPSRLNSSMMTCRSAALVEPSKRRYSMPTWPNTSSSTSSVIVHCEKITTLCPPSRSSGSSFFSAVALPDAKAATSRSSCRSAIAAYREQ